MLLVAIDPWDHSLLGRAGKRSQEVSFKLAHTLARVGPASAIPALLTVPARSGSRLCLPARQAHVQQRAHSYPTKGLRSGFAHLPQTRSEIVRAVRHTGGACGYLSNDGGQGCFSRYRPGVSVLGETRPCLSDVRVCVVPSRSLHTKGFRKGQGSEGEVW